MSYDIFFVRRDPGQAFEDALDDLEGSFENGGHRALTDVDLEHWDTLLPRARDILGELDLEEDDESARRLVARTSGIELSVIPGEIEIHVPDDRGVDDDIELMSEVYELARAVEDVTGLEGYDPQVGEPVSDHDDGDVTTRRRLPAVDPDDDDDDDIAPTGTTRPLSQPDMAPDRPTPGDRARRRWWEFWTS
ncbi:MAG: hypothetical protein LH461_11255 [Spirochaetaceae bacterium]|nr:hypothetical protein [Spirochaetaceae bacterium]